MPTGGEDNRIAICPRCGGHQPYGYMKCCTCKKRLRKRRG